MNSRIDSIRPLRIADTENVLDLLRAAMPESRIPKTVEFWEWKHLRNPFGESPGVVAVSDGKIVGVRVFLRWKWQQGTQLLLAGRAVDTATHPDWQGKGIFSDLTRQLIESVRSEGMKFIFNTPNKSSLPGYLKMGWKIITHIPLWIRPLRPAKSLFRFAGIGGPIQPSPNHNPVELFFQQFAGFARLDEASGDSRLQTTKTAEYLRWRYLQIPTVRYSAKWQESSDSWAVIIFREKVRKQFQEISISEILSSSDDRGKEIAVHLLKDICFESQADYVVATSPENSSERSILKQSGFIPIGKRGPILTVLNLSDNQNVMNWSHWHCSLGDLELF